MDNPLEIAFKVGILTAVALHFILVRPKEPGNVGASARAMKNFGYTNLRLVAPQRPLNKNAYAFASHAGDVLDNAVEYPTLKDALSNITVAIGTTARARKDDRANYTARHAADLFTKDLTKQEIAIVFGPEDWGLSNEDLDLCQGYIQIPTDNYASLNLGQAVQVLAYEFFQAKLPNSKTSHTQAIQNNASEQNEEELTSSRDKMERMYEQLREVLHLTDFTDEQREATAMRLMRRIFDKAALTERELGAIRGLWRQVNWAAKDELKKDKEKTS